MFYDNFEKACASKGEKPNPVAMKCGGTKSSASSWKKGSSPNSDIVIKLAEYLNVSTDYLLLGKDPTIPIEYKSLIASYQELSKDNQQLLQNIISSMIKIQNDNNKPSEIECITIRHYLYKVSAGLGESLVDEDKWEEINVVKTFESEQADFAVTVDGDSMLPDYKDGDIVLVKQQNTIELGQIGIFTMNNNQGFIKESGVNCLISHNPEYDDIIPTENDIIECNGLVLGIAERVE